MAKQFTYGKKEKLKSRKLTEQLFGSGKSFTVFPLKVFYSQNPADMPINETQEFPLKVGVSVSVRNFKKATDRNRIKRLLREAYRTEKIPLLEFAKTNDMQLALFIIYIDKTLPDYAFIKSKMQFALERLIKHLHEKTAANT
jgi:ribonuclease P protein component